MGGCRNRQSGGLVHYGQGSPGNSVGISPAMVRADCGRPHIRRLSGSTFGYAFMPRTPERCVNDLCASEQRDGVCSGARSRIVRASHRQGEWPSRIQVPQFKRALLGSNAKSFRLRTAIPNERACSHTAIGAKIEPMGGPSLVGPRCQCRGGFSLLRGYHGTSRGCKKLVSAIAAADLLRAGPARLGGVRTARGIDSRVARRRLPVRRRRKESTRMHPQWRHNHGSVGTSPVGITGNLPDRRGRSLHARSQD